MSAIEVHHGKTHVATIVRQGASEPGYEPQRPWALWNLSAATEARYPNLNAAKYAATMAWPNPRFLKNP